MKYLPYRNRHRSAPDRATLITLLYVFTVLTFTAWSQNCDMGSTSYQLNLKSGWNLFSIPSQPLVTTPGSFFNNIHVGPIWTFVDDKFTNPAEIRPGVGYCVYSTIDHPFTICTDSPVARVVEIRAGQWNLLGPINIPSIPALAVGPTIWTWEDDRFQGRTRRDPHELLRGYFIFGAAGRADSTANIRFENIRPLANAGSDRNSPTGSTVLLNGSLSSDADGDRLSFQWSIVEKPAGSQTTLSRAASALPAIVLDVTGKYIVHLIVSDAVSDSLPNTVIISTDVNPPQIAAGLANDTGSSATDAITSDPTVTGSITEENLLTSFTAGFDDTALNSFTDVTGDVQSDRSFTLTPQRLSEINGGALASGSHVLHLIATDEFGNTSATFDLAFILRPAASSPSSHSVFDLNVHTPATAAVTRIHGSTGLGSKGLPVAGGHDCDGDSLIDSAFSSITASPLGRSGAGEVALVFGSGSIGATIDTAGFQSTVLKIAGDQDMEVAGAEIWIDDVTGDGLGDLLICRQNYTPATGREGAGALTILIGGSALRTTAATQTYLDLRSPPAAVTVVTFVGDKAYDRLGIWVRTGDVTGDGIADIVVGADEVDAATETNRGAVYVIRGGSHLAATQVVDLANFGSTPLAGHLARIHPPAGSTEFHFGATCQIADLDGNGRGEVLAAAALNRAGATIRLSSAPAGTGRGSGGSTRGTVYIAWDDNFPTGTWTNGYEFTISSAPGSRSIIGGASFHQTFGEELLGGQDYDHDGNADLFAGDLVANAGNGSNSGAGHVFYNAALLRGLEFDLNTPPAQIKTTLILGPRAGSLGADTVAQGDFDNDGIADLVIGNPHDSPSGRISAGSMHILFGQDAGWPAVIDLSDSGLPMTDVVRVIEIIGAKGTAAGDTGDTLAYSAAAADIDGDGHTDVIVNEMVGNGVAANAIDVGNLLLISGDALINLSSPP